MRCVWMASAWLHPPPPSGTAPADAPESGFTLLETLVALVVLGFIMAGLTQGLRFGINAWQAQASALAGRGDLDAAERTLRALIGRMEPGGMAGQPPLLRGTPHGIAFTTELPQEAVGLATPDADVSLAVTDGHELQLLWLEHIRNRTRPPPPPPGRVALLRDVKRLDIQYLGAAGWRTDWAGSPLPKLVRIRIVFTEASGRHGPDIVVMPMREQWRQ